MHDKRGRRMGREALARELVAGFVLLEIDLLPREPFSLDAQHHHDLRLLQRSVEVALNRDAGARAHREPRKELSRAAEHYACTQSWEQEHIGAGHPAMKNVSGDGYGDACKRVPRDRLNVRTQMGEDGTQIEQSLRRVLVHAIACVEYG